MIANESASEEMVSTWERFCAAATGGLLPLNFIDLEEGAIVIGHECAEDDAPITCRNGQVVRKLYLAFDHTKRAMVWN